MLEVDHQAMVRRRRAAAQAARERLNGSPSSVYAAFVRCAAAPQETAPWKAGMTGAASWLIIQRWLYVKSRRRV